MDQPPELIPRSGEGCAPSSASVLHPSRALGAGSELARALVSRFLGAGSQLERGLSVLLFLDVSLEAGSRLESVRSQEVSLGAGSGLERALSREAHRSRFLYLLSW